MRRHPDFSRPLEHRGFVHWFIVVVAAFIPAALLIMLIVLALTGRSHAHDLWINGTRSSAGEWCCGANDCGVVASSGIRAVQGGYSIRSTVTYGVGITGNPSDGPTHSESVNEIVPYSQSLPSPDGAYWRCKRPDGSNRCFFAPKPGS